MRLKRTCKLVKETMVEEPTQDLDVPSEAIRDDEQKDFKEKEDLQNCDDHENEEELMHPQTPW
jgi:hypothetical protein